MATHPTLTKLRALLDARRPGQPRLPYETDLLDLLRALGPAAEESDGPIEASEADRVRLGSRELSVAVALDNDESEDEELLAGAKALLAVLEPDDEGDLRRAIETLEERIELEKRAQEDDNL